MHGGPDYSPLKLTPVAGSNKDGHSKTSGRHRNPVDIPRRRFVIDYYKLFSIPLMRRARVIVVSRTEMRLVGYIFSPLPTVRYTILQKWAATAKELFLSK